MFGSIFGFRDHIIEKKLLDFSFEICLHSIGFSIGYCISQKYLQIWVLVSVLDLDQNRGFSRTLLDCWSVANWTCKLAV